MFKGYYYINSIIVFQKLIKPHLKAHSVHDKKKDTKDLKPIEIDQQFYSQLPKKLVKQLYDDIYKADFEMLGYEYPQEYIDMGYDE